MASPPISMLGTTEVGSGRPPTTHLGAAALTAGLLYALGAPGFGLWPLSFVALLPLAWAVERHQLGPSKAAAMGLLAGTTAQLIALHWLAPMGQRFFEISAPVAWLLSLGFCALQGGQLALFAGLLAWARPRVRSLGWAMVAALGLSELLWPMLFRIQLGHTLHTWPRAIQIADLGGVTWVSLLVVLTGAGLYEASVARRFRPSDWSVVAAAALSWLLTLSYGSYRIDALDARLAEAPRARVGIVQPNVTPEEKLQDLNANLRRHIAVTRDLEREGPLDLLVWPEAAMATVRDARQFGKKVRFPLLYGGIEHEGDGRYNTAFLYTGGDSDYRYRKHELLVFGEYIPWVDQFPKLAEMLPNTTHFRAGRTLEPAELNGHRLSVLICYEDTLAGFVRNVVHQASPELLVNLTNDGWFGDTNEPWMHLATATFRAVEHHLYLVRASQTGVSAVVDPAGRLQVSSGVYEPAALRAEVAWLEPESLYGRFGNWLTWLMVLSMLCAVWRRRERPITGPDSAPDGGPVHPLRRSDASSE